MNPTIAEFERVMAAKGHRLFTGQSKRYNLNLIGIRTNTNRANYFDDWLFVLWKYNDVWNISRYQITTDPGIYWLKHPENVNGTAIVKEGQYPGLWKVGLHKGYKALQQIGRVTVIRDYNRDENHDFVLGREESGIFGINCHRSNANRKSTLVEKWSAGCQVFADPSEFRVFLAECDQAAALWQNEFTYTLLHERDFSN